MGPSRGITMRGAVIGLIITGVLIPILVFSNIVFFIQLQTLKRQISGSDVEDTNLLDEIAQRDQQISNLQNQISALESQIHALERELDELEDLLDLYRNVPSGYYNTHSFRDRSNTVWELEDFLAFEFKLPTAYEKGRFDCSESSAYLEWALEDAGFNAWIVCGPTPWSGEGKHAWVHVFTEEYVVAIESTALTGSLISKLSYLLFRDAQGVVYIDDEYGWQYYHDYDERFKNIYGVVENDNSIRDWDWWTVTGFPS